MKPPTGTTNYSVATNTEGCSGWNWVGIWILDYQIKNVQLTQFLFKKRTCTTSKSTYVCSIVVLFLL